MAAPLCRYCGVPIRKKTVTVYLRARPIQSHEHSQGDYARYLQVKELPASIDDCCKLTNHTVVSVKRKDDGQTIGYFSEWDGESYTDKFFCNGEHARRFGYAAARANMETAAYQAAIQKQRKESITTAATAAKPGEV